jgi:mannose-6-phosphate isomerase-like protein (cupin superfamily)
MGKTMLACVLCAGLTGAVAVASAQDGVGHFQQAAVEAAFAQGAALIETPAYKIHASRRTEAGQAEVHVRDTDLIYVREGRAVLVTGGRVVDPREVAPDEIRGSRIADGVEREIGPGDVITVPNGTPHWFERVEGPVLYYVVKVTEQGASR